MECFKRRLSLSKEMEIKLQAHLDSTHEEEFITMKTRHIKKLNKLMGEKDKQEDMPIVDKWVHNISKHQLTETECSILSHGLNFAIMSKTMLQ